MSAAREMIERAWAIRRDALAMDSERARQLVLTSEVQPLLCEALEALRKAGNASLVVVALGKLSHVERDLRHDVAAEELLREAIQLGRKEQNPARLAHSIRHLADLYMETGRDVEAHALLLESVGLYRSMTSSHPLDFANALYRLAKSSESSDPKAAHGMWIEAKDVYQQLSILEGVKECEAHIAKLESKLS